MYVFRGSVLLSINVTIIISGVLIWRYRAACSSTEIFLVPDTKKLSPRLAAALVQPWPPKNYLKIACTVCPN